MREIKDKKDIDFLLSIEEKDISKKLLIELFGDFTGKPRFEPFDILIVPPDSYGPISKRNKNEFRTTVGLWIFNRFMIERTLFDIFGYVNEGIDKGKLSSMNKTLSYALLEDKITLNEQLKLFLHKQQFLMRQVSIICPNYSMKMLKTSKHLEKRKKELIKKHKQELEKGNEVIASEIEKELLALAKEYLADDPSLDMYNSKARGSFDNNFKNMFIMKGAIMNPEPGKGFDITTSNYMDGISKEEYATFANSLVGGAYAKAKNTEVGGYWVKLYLSAFQHLMLDEPDSDCGTKRYIEVELDKDSIEGNMYNYIIDGSSLIELTSDNMNKYLGKKVKIRFSSLCESKTGFCNKCAGNLYYRIGIRNVGMTAPKIPTKVMMSSMKRFHDSSIRLVELDPMVAFGLK